jgi:hypothetical protein
MMVSKIIDDIAFPPWPFPPGGSPRSARTDKTSGRAFQAKIDLGSAFAKRGGRTIPRAARELPHDTRMAQASMKSTTDATCSCWLAQCQDPSRARCASRQGAVSAA